MFKGVIVQLKIIASVNHNKPLYRFVFIWWDSGNLKTESLDLYFTDKQWNSFVYNIIMRIPGGLDVCVHEGKTFISDGKQESFEITRIKARLLWESLSDITA